MAAGPGQASGHGGRALALGVGAVVLGAALILLDTSARWIVARVAGASGGSGAPAATFRVALSGASSAPALDGLGLVALAGAAAVFATRRWGRAVIGALLVAVAAGVLAVTIRLLADPTALVRRSSDVHQIATGSGAVRSVAVSAAAWVPLPGAVLIALGGLLIAVRSRGAGGLSRRHTVPERRPARRPADAWEAIERGEDPT